MRIIIATKNKGKMREFSRILADTGIEVLSQEEAEVDIDVLETGTTFSENAYIKAKAVCDATGTVAVADDSGLAVEALSGAPGVYSARYGGESLNYNDKIAKLLNEIESKGTDNRNAKFVCAICACFPNGESFTVTGECHGTIGYEQRGNNGFGYDPIFMVGSKSFSEISDNEKDEISHRGIALRKFIRIFNEYIDMQN